MSPHKHFNVPPVIDPAVLTAREQWLLDYLVENTNVVVQNKSKITIPKGEEATTTTTTTEEE